MKIILPFWVGLIFLFVACSNADYEALEESPFEAADKAMQDTSVNDENEWLEPVVSSSSESLVDSLDDLTEPFLLSSSSGDSILYLPLDDAAEERKVDSLIHFYDDVLFEPDTLELDSVESDSIESGSNEPDMGLPSCSMENEGEIARSVKDEMYYVCRDSEWVYALVSEYDTYGETCTLADVGKIINGAVSDYSKYYCTANGWIDYVDWSWEVPKEARLNPEISYDTLVDPRDGKVYKTIKIASQTWMAENLNYADSVKTESLKGNNWCYHNDTMNCDVVGRYYTWAAAIDSVGLAENEALDCGYGKRCWLPDTIYGICPPGWHLPKEKEWYALLDALGGKDIAGRVLKSQSGWFLHGCGTDSTGFSALPAGRKFVDDYFDYEGLIAYFWSSSEYTEDYARFMGLTYDHYWEAFMYTHKKSYGFSVRCLKNSEI